MVFKKNAEHTSLLIAIRTFNIKILCKLFKRCLFSLKKNEVQNVREKYSFQNIILPFIALIVFNSN